MGNLNPSLDVIRRVSVLAQGVIGHGGGQPVKLVLALKEVEIWIGHLQKKKLTELVQKTRETRAWKKQR